MSWDRVDEVRCKECGTPCQGTKTPLGTYCKDCYKKLFGEYPWDSKGGLNRDNE